MSGIPVWALLVAEPASYCKIFHMCREEIVKGGTFFSKVVFWFYLPALFILVILVYLTNNQAFHKLVSPFLFFFVF